jgi:hypothetical protein
MSQLLSPPQSPRDHRYYVPRRPSPLSLPPIAPHLALPAASSNMPPLSALAAFAMETPRRTGAKMPRYPIEKQRRAWKEFETRNESKKQDRQTEQEEEGQRQMQAQEPMLVPKLPPSRNNSVASTTSDARGSSTSLSGGGSTTSLPLTPRSAAISSASSQYSQHDQDLDEEEQQLARGKRPSSTFCSRIFGPCFGGFAGRPPRVE